MMSDNSMTIARQGGKVRIHGPSMAVVTAASLALTAFIGHLSQQSQVAHLESMNAREREMAIAMERVERKQDAVTDLRISQCHTIQKQSIAANSKLSEVMGEFLLEQRSQVLVWQQMNKSLDTIETVLRENGKMISNLERDNAQDQGQ